MRWVKHLTMAHRDEAIAEALEENGPSIYGIYWLVIEDIGGPMEKGKLDPTAIHSVSKWAQICHCPPRIFRSSLDVLKEKGLFICSTDGDRIRITIPNILKYKDEYSKKSGDGPDSKADTDREQNRADKKPAGKGLSLVPSDWESVLTSAIDSTGKSIHARHPKPRRDVGEKAVAKFLIAILKRKKLHGESKVREAVEYLAALDARHDRLCSSPQWAKDGGEFAKGLNNWIGSPKEFFEQEPTEGAIRPRDGPNSKKEQADLEFFSRIKRDADVRAMTEGEFLNG